MVVLSDLSLILLPCRRLIAYAIHRNTLSLHVAMTVRMCAMLRLADYLCLLTSEPLTATLMTNIIALHKETVAAPARICKDCASAALMDFRHGYCQWKEAV